MGRGNILRDCCCCDFLSMEVSPPLKKRVFRCDCQSVYPALFKMTKIKVSKVGKSSNDMIINVIISDDEVVASYVPPRFLFLFNNKRGTATEGWIVDMTPYRDVYSHLKSLLKVYKTNYSMPQRSILQVLDGPSLQIQNFFLDASSHLYKRVCQSVCPSVRMSVG